ncbi:MAG: hypothetical protein QOE83_263 [Actinomycetota bacterium]|nr:hypothetical protein [Actinomycetota bacterium]
MQNEPVMRRFWIVLIVPVAAACAPHTVGAAADTTPTPVLTPSCVNGFTSPASGSANYVFPLHQISVASGEPGPFHVVSMRYFVGPESPPSSKGYLIDIERWYVKLTEPGTPAFKGRFLVERRNFGSGVSAVAPFSTHDWQSPDWSGFQWNSAAPKAKSYPGLPGEWPGIKYDFVKGGAGLAIPGLPAAVVRCLDGT